MKQNIKSEADLKKKKKEMDSTSKSSLFKQGYGKATGTPSNSQVQGVETHTS